MRRCTNSPCVSVRAQETQIVRLLYIYLHCIAQGEPLLTQRVSRTSHIVACASTSTCVLHYAPARHACSRCRRPCSRAMRTMHPKTARVRCERASTVGAPYVQACHVHHWCGSYWDLDALAARMPLWWTTFSDALCICCTCMLPIGT